MSATPCAQAQFPPPRVVKHAFTLLHVAVAIAMEAFGMTHPAVVAAAHAL
jgi:hypothetical protein